MDQELRCVFVANGDMHAHQVRSFLEAAGMEVTESGEALRHTHGLTLDGLGGVAILVSQADEKRARELLDSADSGAFRLADEAEG
jgi:hypothetical protein